MEILTQYKATIELGLLGRRTLKSPNRAALPPPFGNRATYSIGSKSFGSASYPKSEKPYTPQNNAGYPGCTTPQNTNSTAPNTTLDDQAMTINMLHLWMHSRQKLK